MKSAERIIAERGRDLLPVQEPQDPPHLVFVRQCAARMIAMAKRKAIATLKNQPMDVDAEMEALGVQIWHNGYNSGLSDMDKMHNNFKLKQ